MRNICLFVLFMLISLGSVLLSAVDIPFFLEFRTANELLHYPGRDERELNWDDDYQISFGIDSLRVGDYGCKLVLKSMDNFIKEQVLLDHAELVYIKGRHGLSLSSQNLGFGNGYRTNNTYHNDPRFQKPLFKSYRFNGFSYLNSTPSSLLKLSFGALDFDSGVIGLDAAKRFGLSGLRLETGIKAELRIRDSFHGRPLALYGLNLALQDAHFSFRSDGVLAHYLPHAGAEAMLKVFQISEFAIKPHSNTELYLANSYETQAVYPQSRLELSAGFRQSLGRLTINPDYEYQDLDQDKIQIFSTLLEYSLHRDIQLGLYYRHTDIQDSQSGNIYGLQAKLHRSF